MEADRELKDFSNVFSRNPMEFATVAREYCVFVENVGDYTKKDYMTVAARLLPLLYVKASVLPQLERQSDDDLEEIVDEETYEHVRIGIHEKLCSHDDYVEVFKEDFKYSESPVAASVSEDMADIYQDLRNFCEQFQSGVDEIMNDAIVAVSEKFQSYWGQRLCNALKALHCALYSGDSLEDEVPAPRSDDYQDDEQQENDDELGNDGDAPYFLRQMGMKLRR